VLSSETFKWATGLVVALMLGSPAALAQNPASRSSKLPSDRFKSGESTLHAFAPVAAAVRGSIVKLDLNGKTIAFGTVVDADGLVLTKASEITDGKLTCRLAGGEEVAAEMAAVDEDNDVGLVKVHAAGLKPVEWSSSEPVVGQWVVTPGLGAVPQAAGVLSVPPRKIYPPRALIGVQLDFNTTAPKIAQVMSGLGAEKAGLKPGDLIRSVNDAPMESGEELIATLREFREGQTVKLRVERERETFSASVQMMVPKPERTSRGFDREERMNRLGGELSRRAEGFALALQHDTILQPWECGGPLVDLDGKAIGLNIARAGRVASYALPASLAKQLAEKLKSDAQVKRNETPLAP
jgi:serine protease Do